MKVPDLIRYGLWCVLLVTANANRRKYNMTTTWLPHLLTNTLTLLLPDFIRLVIREDITRRTPSTLIEGALDITHNAAIAVVRDNPSYVVYVTPLALGYILSHPRFDIYKGELGDIRLGGFGLDAIPHSATAMGLSALVIDTSWAAVDVVSPSNPLMPLLRWCNAHPGLFSAMVLALATLVWETAEYNVHEYELNLRGDESQINMQWSPEDTLRDMVANAAGWLAAQFVARRATVTARHEFTAQQQAQPSSTTVKNHNQ